MRNLVTAIFMMFACQVAAFSQDGETGDAQSSNPVTRMTLSRAESLIPRMSSQSVASMTDSNKAEGVDTIATESPEVKIILRRDGTWDYWRDGSEIQKRDFFNTKWDNSNVDPFKLEWSDFPDKSYVWLVDSTDRYHYPGDVNNISISSRYGPRHGRFHRGIDIRLPHGTPEYAAFDGKVRISHYVRGYGNLVVIRHENGLESIYGHLSKLDVKEGDWVEAGRQIGLAGSTGRSSGSHLHFEVRYKGYAIDPEWIIDFETGILRHRVFVLKKKYLDSSSRFVPESDAEEEEIALADEADRLEAERLEAERKAARYYKIRSGDTLSRIAVNNGTTVTALCRLNGITPKTVLRVGRTIRVK